MAIREKSFGPDHLDVAASLTHLGDIYEAQGKYAEAEESYERALAIEEKSLGPAHPDVAEILTKLGGIYKAQGNFTEAEQAYKRTLAIKSKRGVIALCLAAGGTPATCAGAAAGGAVVGPEDKEPSGKVEDKGLEPKPKGNGDEKPGSGGEGSGGNEMPSSIKLQEYKVVLGADASLKMPGLPGELRVWIGGPNVDPNLPRDMTSATGSFPAIGETAKVTPFAPAFEIEPTESICMTIDPTGSAVRFTLKPKKIGTFNVGADVQLFRSNNCSGAPVPKATETLQVQVVVNTEEKLQERTKQLGEVFWTKFLDFWGLFVALVFALFLFLIKGRLKKWFSFGSDS